jgi:hypothetical protein
MRRSAKGGHNRAAASALNAGGAANIGSKKEPPKRPFLFEYSSIYALLRRFCS